jgi:hypothetical protein
MLIVEAGKKGKSVKLHQAEKERIFIDADDNGKSIVIVGDRVVRVDEPSTTMYSALNDRVYSTPGILDKHTLLVETDEAPTPLPSTSTPGNQVTDLSGLTSLANQLGYNLVPVDQGESAKTGEITPAGSNSKATDSKDSKK